MYKHILVATDGSDLACNAVSEGAKLAKALNSQLSCLFVGEQTYIPEVEGTIPPRAEQALEYAENVAADASVGIVCSFLLNESPAEGIVQYARQHSCDLIVMATRGRSRVGKFFLGSVAAEVLASCHIPVVLHR